MDTGTGGEEGSESSRKLCARSRIQPRGKLERYLDRVVDSSSDSGRPVEWTEVDFAVGESRRNLRANWVTNVLREDISARWHLQRRPRKRTGYNRKLNSWDYVVGVARRTHLGVKIRVVRACSKRVEKLVRILIEDRLCILENF